MVRRLESAVPHNSRICFLISSCSVVNLHVLLVGQERKITYFYFFKSIPVSWTNAWQCRIVTHE